MALRTNANSPSGKEFRVHSVANVSALFYKKCSNILYNARLSATDRNHFLYIENTMFTVLVDVK